MPKILLKQHVRIVIDFKMMLSILLGKPKTFHIRVNSPSGFLVFAKMCFKQGVYSALCEVSIAPIFKAKYFQAASAI